MTPFALTRRLALAALPAALLLAGGPAASQEADYPARQPIRMLVPAAPGGTTDIAARMLAEPLSKLLGQSVVVENRAGAAGGIATQATARSAPDGYAILFQNSSFHVITPQITANTPWDPLKDFAPVAHVMLAPQVVVVRADLPIHSLKELVEHDKRASGKLNYASSGIGSMQHVGAEMFNQMTGARFTHVPYKGTAPALTDLLGGSVDMTITTPPPLLPYFQQGRLRPLAVTSNTRLPSLPDVPTVKEAGFPDLQASSWLAVYAPAGTPDAVVKKLAAAIQTVVLSPDFRQKSETLGAEAIYMDPKALGQHTREEFVRWGKVVRSASIRAD
jgi:tripartite-type tricarboxylate transporter receptor subunit TctC